MIPEHLGPPVATQSYFIGSSTYQKRSIFQVDAWARVFLKTLYLYRRQQKYLLHAFVLMPNHFHVVLTPAAGITLEKAAQMIKGGSAYQLKQAGREGVQVWQRGFTDRRIRNAKEYEALVQYTHQNPVKAGLVARAEEYRYSSAYPGFKLDPPRDYLSG
ncbi:MAG TPA: transposase [Terriglobales bacterium]|nr:transposase [Terriglobales bacterium]